MGRIVQLCGPEECASYLPEDSNSIVEVGLGIRVQQSSIRDQPCGAGWQRTAVELIDAEGKARHIEHVACSALTCSQCAVSRSVFFAMHAGTVLNFFTNREEPIESNQGAAKPLIDALPAVCFSHGSLGDDVSCAVCLCDYTEGSVLRRLPCGHHFHRCCADEWLRRNKQCPLCRCPIDSLVGICQERQSTC